MPDLKFTNPQGQTLTVNSPDGSTPSESELDTMFSRAYPSDSSSNSDKPAYDAINKAIEQITPKPESPLNPIQSGAVGLVNNQANVPQALQNTGISPERIGLDNKGNVTVDNININRTGLNNVNDIAGAVTRGLTSNLPLATQLGGDVLLGMSAPATAGTSLLALAAFNSATSATGEAVRQLASKGISGENFNAASMGEQAALGAAAPYVGKVLEKAYMGTKVALLNTLGKVADRQGVDKVAALGNQLVSNLDPAKTTRAIELVRGNEAAGVKPDLRILDNANADEGNFIQSLTDKIFGKSGDVAGNIQKNYASNANGAAAAKGLYTDILKVLPQEDVATILQQGSSVNRMAKSGALTSLGEDISNATNTLMDTAGKNLGAARRVLLKQAGGVDMKLGDVNSQIVPELKRVGLLQEVAASDGRVGYKINPDFSVTSTGKGQKAIFEDLVNRFFNKETVGAGQEITKASIDAAQKEAAKRIGKGELGKTANPLGDLLSGNSGRTKETLYFPDKQMKYKDFHAALNNIDVQISGNEFDKVGDLSPTLAGYLKGLRGKTMEVADSVGNKSVPLFTAKYSELADTLKPIRDAEKSKDGVAMENYMKQLANGGSERQLLNASEINNTLAKSGVNMNDDLAAWRATESLAKLDAPIVRSQVVKNMGNLLEGAYNDNPSGGVLKEIKDNIDAALPRSQQFTDLAETHVLAKALNKDTTNVFKAGFLAHGLQLGSLLGAVTGGIGGGLVGGVGGTMAGLALQNPAIRKGIITSAAKNAGGSFRKSISPAQAKLIGNLLTRGSASAIQGKN